MSYIDIDPQKVPGPGRYDEFRYNESPKWSLRPRVSSECTLYQYLVFAKTTQKIVPGPGTHENK